MSLNPLAILIWHPVPLLRQVTLWLAERSANLAVARKSIVALYLIGLFLSSRWPYL